MGEGWGKQVMEIKEGSYCDEHWVIHGSVKSLYCAPGTNINCVLIILEFKVK